MPLLPIRAFRRPPRWLPLFAAATLSLTSTLPWAPKAAAATLPSGFQDQIVISNLIQPTSVAFSPDGRIFVAEKRGIIKVYQSLSDTAPTQFADLRTDVYNLWDRGLEGITLDPGFPGTPYVYAIYTRDALPGGNSPHWGTAGQSDDPCPTPPGPTTDGCVATGRIVRLTASGNVSIATLPLVTGWCQQFPSHSMDQIVFGPDGQLYAAGGEGASYNAIDYGQFGGTLANTPTPANPCGDPPSAPGTALTPPTAEGGALRAQDLQTSGDPVGLNGSIIRVDPATGAASAGNPNINSSDLNARRIVAYGARNPYRFTFRPGTSELWIGDVGYHNWEEIDRIVSPTSAVRNMGWPCYEGPGQMQAFATAGLDICTNLYAQGSGAVLAPYYAYAHGSPVVPGEACIEGSGAITGDVFKQGTAFPTAYNGALFFADYVRNCIWAMHAGANGLPDPNQIEVFDSAATNPVQLAFGTDGALYYVDFGTGSNDGTVHRISYFSSNQPPIAAVTATPTSGATPLMVQFDASGSSDADPGDTITYSWDLDGNGTFGDSTLVKPTHTYSTPGTYTVKVKVTDNHGASDTAQVVISAGNSPPVPVIDTPLTSQHWKVGDILAISGHATDAQDGSIPAANLHWNVLIHHCPSTCHTHDYGLFTGASYSLAAPDHEYPSYLELTLTATDSQGLSASVSRRLDPSTVQLSMNTAPTGRTLSVGSFTGVAPFTRVVIAKSANSVSAPNQQAGGTIYTFKAWSDGKAQTHVITAGTTDASYTATFSASQDTTPPTITSRAPPANATGVALSPTVSAHFSEQVTGVSTVSMAISKVSDLVNLPATVSYDTGSHTATLHPSAPLDASTTYRVALSGRIKDVAGNPLGWTTWTFTTGAPVTFKQGTLTGYQFNASGGVTGSKTFTLAANSSALASKRQAITGQSGMFLAISSGVWAGYWVRESGGVYLTSSPIADPAGANATFSPARSLIFGKGTHTGYQFNASGGMTAARTFTLAANSSAPTTRRSTITNQSGRWFLVSSGVWAGYWLRSSDVIYLSP